MLSLFYIHKLNKKKYHFVVSMINIESITGICMPHMAKLYNQLHYKKL